MEEKINSNIEFYYFIKVMKRYTDDQSILSESEISEKIKEIILEELGIETKNIDRRKIYKFANNMKELGFDISTYKENKEGYYLKSRAFELKEIKILVESIVANKFITKAQTEDILEKLYKLGKEYDEYSLNSRTYLSSRAKSQNEDVIENIYLINEAIDNEKQIEFEYYTYKWDKRLVPRKDKKGNPKKYIVNPIGMVIRNGRYYVIFTTYKSDKVIVKNYRVDMMKNIQVLEIEQEDFSNKEEYKQHMYFDSIKNKYIFDIGLYTKKNFKMYNGGYYDKVIVRVKESTLNLFIDEIGIEDINITKLDVKDDNRVYEIEFEANVSQGLKKWLLALGSEVRVIYPNSLKEEIIIETKKILGLYK